MRSFSVNCGGRILELGKKTCVMGILNVTPDSFSDGGRFVGRDRAVAHAIAMVDAGADIIDVGGESTRPFADEVASDHEAERVVPVIRLLAEKISVPISIDTVKADVAERAIAAGASIINDISAMTFDSRMAGLAARHGLPVILMHMKGTPRTMQVEPSYGDVVGEVRAFLADAVERVVAEGVSRDKIIIDPGIGFGKTVDHNLRLINELGTFEDLGVPLLMGTSRKSFIRKLLTLPGEAEPACDHPVVEVGTQATVAASILGGAHIVRVHDVASTIGTVKILDAIRNPGCCDG